MITLIVRRADRAFESGDQPPFYNPT